MSRASKGQAVSSNCSGSVVVVTVVITTFLGVVILLAHVFFLVVTVVLVHDLLFLFGGGHGQHSGKDRNSSTSSGTTKVEWLVGGIIVVPGDISANFSAQHGNTEFDIRGSHDQGKVGNVVNSTKSSDWHGWGDTSKHVSGETDKLHDGTELQRLMQLLVLIDILQVVVGWSNAVVIEIESEAETNEWGESKEHWEGGSTRFLLFHHHLVTVHLLSVLVIDWSVNISGLL